jgi:hypothetical protein
MIPLLVLLAAAPANAWPTDLTKDWSAILIVRNVPNEKARSASVRLGTDGVWRMSAPFRGDADVDAVKRLQIALEAPQLVAAVPKPADVSLAIVIEQGKRKRRIITKQAELNQPIALTVDDVAFVASPVELANKLPDPGDFVPPGLWVAARNDAISIEVKGKTSYKLAGKGEEWKVVAGGEANHDLDDVVGVIVGRQAIGHPKEVARALGFESPVAIATVCTEKTCRDFKFASLNGHYYGMAPDSDPIELRDNDWKLLVDGPLKPPSTTTPRK